MKFGEIKRAASEYIDQPEMGKLPSVWKLHVEKKQEVKLWICLSQRGVNDSSSPSLSLYPSLSLTQTHMR